MRKIILTLILSCAAVFSNTAPLSNDPLAVEGETHLRNIRQLTESGENAEGYFSFDGRALIYQSTHGDLKCDQIFTLDLKTGRRRMVSTGKGRTTCGYFFPDGRRILYASTHGAGAECPPRPDYSQGYVWPLYAGYDLYAAGRDGSRPRALAPAPGYDAEATISPDGRRIVFTSVRDGDLELYSMKLDGSDLRRLTHEKGYDGGAFYSPDSHWVVYRAHHPKDPATLARYQKLLNDGLIEPRSLELFVMKADGSDRRQLTSNGAANFAPFYHPDGRRIIFSSNLADPRGRDFDLYLVGVDGQGLKRITFNKTFDGFPMFSPDGRKLVFASNRNALKSGDTNLFLADWAE